jgi:hypothetical protein
MNLISNFVRLRIQPTSTARELIQLLESRNERPMSRRRSGGSISTSTQFQHVQKIVALVAAVQKSDSMLLHLTDFNRAHLNICLDYILLRCQKAGGIDNWIVSLNRLTTLLNKKTLYVSSKELRQSVGIRSRTGFSVVNKAPKNLAVLDSAIELIKETEPRVAAILAICRALPLRVAEAACLDIPTALKEATETNHIPNQRRKKRASPLRPCVEG